MGETTRRGSPGRARRRAGTLPPHAGSLAAMIWASPGGISRAELSRRTELARSTISLTVGSLLAKGLVTEVGAGPSQGGRRPILLRFEDDAFAVVGVDVGRTHVAAALTNLRGRVIAWERRAHPVHADPAGTRAVIIALIEACLARWRCPPERLVAIGVGMPSPVADGPEALSRLVLPAWKGRGGFEELEERFGVPVLLDNDANLGALAEHWWGAGRGIDDLAYVEVSAGVGSGHIVRGKVYRGANGVAGELGHVPVDPAGAPCECGLRGCLTHAVSEPDVLARALELRPEYPGAPLADGEITMEALEAAAAAGDRLALRVVADTVGFLATGIAAMVNLLNPAMVIVGGALARLGDLLVVPLRRAVEDRTRVSSAPPLRLVASSLGERAVALGAATYALETALADVGLFPDALPAPGAAAPKG